jgi:hypothetical protein
LFSPTRLALIPGIIGMIALTSGLIIIWLVLRERRQGTPGGRSFV